MPFVITDPCIGTKDTACVDVCPVDCIHPRKDEPEFETATMLYIHPDECIDCGACVPACPVAAIYDSVDSTPSTQTSLIEANAIYRAGDADAVSRAETLVKAHESAHPELMAIPPAERAAAGNLIAVVQGMTMQQQALKYGQRRLLRRASRSIPWIGTAIALLTIGSAIRRKGFVRGGIDSALNALPFVGGLKNAAEVARGRDFLRDRPRPMTHV